MRRRCGSLSSSNCHFAPCQEPLSFLPLSRGITQRRFSIQREIVAGHASPVTGPSAHAVGSVASITSEDTCSGSRKP
jgi:hypothetical protein